MFALSILTAIPSERLTSVVFAAHLRELLLSWPISLISSIYHPVDSTALRLRKRCL
jgi:hypothetical protein